MRLNSWTGTEGLPVSSLNCDRPLRSEIRAPETIISTGGQITESIRPCAHASHCSTRTCCDLNRKTGRLWATCRQAMGHSVLSGVGHRGLC